MAATYVVEGGYISSPLLMDTPEIVQCIDVGERHLERFWKRNVSKHFSKSYQYNLIVSKFGKVSFTPFKHTSTGQMRNAIEVKWNRFDHRVSVRFKAIFNPKDGQEYMTKLIHGTDETKGAYDPSLNIRIKTGVRSATGHSDWDMWMQEFGHEMDNTMAMMAECIIPKLSPEIKKAIANAITRPVGEF
jgi:hypothetical protein